ncbi:PREDICTED: uncharacterized protein LOC104812213 [Tarenaya hassleriana]|uniref:uncharacterized protein LOC104812213 n=1 Tax=Tarenaya hassleriana TaxID=28532 RepID=UPI00053C6D95|nr:PREDICTED: uncharacterized protein LOC104812213 [Tarenaya hassleriana]
MAAMLLYPSQIKILASNLDPLMYSLLFFSLLALSLLFLLFASFLLFKTSRKTSVEKEELDSESEPTPEPGTGLSEISDSSQQLTHENDPTRVTNSRIYELLLSDKKDEPSGGGDQGVCGRKKKRGKKKKPDPRGEENDLGGEKPAERDASGPDTVSGSGSPSGFKPELVCLYPFTSTGSATQRKIKQQYDHLVKCNETKGLTLAQVGEFANCLIEARNELQHKSEFIKRKFTITKALLFKANRSSFERLSQQIYKLEMEQKRLGEDAFVYNWLQQQLKLSPAYKKMLEISTSMELEDKLGAELENPDDESSDISFEELLEQEKKDSFWQKNGRLRTCRTR